MFGDEKREETWISESGFLSLHFHATFCLLKSFPFKPHPPTPPTINCNGPNSPTLLLKEGGSLHEETGEEGFSSQDFYPEPSTPLRRSHPQPRPFRVLSCRCRLQDPLVIRYVGYDIHQAPGRNARGRYFSMPCVSFTLRMLVYVSMSLVYVSHVYCFFMKWTPFQSFGFCIQKFIPPSIEQWG